MKYYSRGRRLGFEPCLWQAAVTSPLAPDKCLYDAELPAANLCYQEHLDSLTFVLWFLLN